MQKAKAQSFGFYVPFNRQGDIGIGEQDGHMLGVDPCIESNYIFISLVYCLGENVHYKKTYFL